MKKLLLILLLVTLCPAQNNGVKPMLGTPADRAHPLSRGLVGWWPMQEGSGGTIYDISGYGNHGTLEADTHWVPGKFGPCLDFDGAGDYVNCGRMQAIENKNVTFSVWINPDAWGNDGTLIRKGTAQSTYDLDINNATEIRWYVTGGDILITQDESVYSLNAWMHIVVSAQANGDGAMYINGVLVGTDSGTALDTISTDDLYLGCENKTDDFFNGQIDDVMIFDRALSQSEIAQLYREPFCMFEQPTPELYVSSGGEPPTTAPQFIMIQLSKIPAWFVVAVIISVLATAIGTTKRKAA